MLSEDEFQAERGKWLIKIERARKRVEVAERERDEGSRLMDELCAKSSSSSLFYFQSKPNRPSVENCHGYAELPIPKIYMSEPLEPIASTSKAALPSFGSPHIVPQPSGPVLSDQDTAYLSAVLRAQTSELAQLREERDRDHRNYAYRVRRYVFQRPRLF